MTEVNTKYMISNFWKKKCTILNVERQEQLDKIIEDISQSTFKNADKDNPISTFRFASWLDTRNLTEFFRDSYKNFTVVKERLDSRIKFTASMCMGKYETVIEAYRALISEENWQFLGFLEPPNYEILREFVYERIGIDRFQDFFNFLVTELVRQANLQNIHFGRRTGQDATDTNSLKYDKEAEYSGYYKHDGYKLDMTHDLDNKTLPLEYTPMKLTADEGQNLILSQERLRKDGIILEEKKIDGAYVKSYENIAKSETSGVHLIYKIQEGWVYNNKGTEENIKKVYQKYHNDEDFKVSPTLEYMLNFLCKKGEYEVVGAYYRNNRMKYAEDNPDLVKKETDERSYKTEGFFSVTKNTTILDSRPRKRGWKEFLRRCGISMLAHIFAALIRIKHGVKNAIGCVTYIT